jgi:hypothetical protein
MQLSGCVGELYLNKGLLYNRCEYKSAWRGLFVLLIHGMGQCEGLTAGMGRNKNTHAFFIL